MWIRLVGRRRSGAGCEFWAAPVDQSVARFGTQYIKWCEPSQRLFMLSNGQFRRPFPTQVSPEELFTPISELINGFSGSVLISIFEFKFRHVLVQLEVTCTTGLTPSSLRIIFPRV